MDPERRKALRKTQKKCIAAQVVAQSLQPAAWQLLQCLSQDFQENLQDDMTGAAQAAPVVPEKGIIRK